jgi:hypothetical protein
MKLAHPCPSHCPTPAPCCRMGSACILLQVVVQCGMIPRTENLLVDRSATRFVLLFPFINKGQPVILDRRRRSLTISINPSVDGSAARSARRAFFCEQKVTCHW